MSIYKRILLATDFSDINLIAVKRAVHLAKQDNCELLILHVIEHFPLDDGPLASVFQYNPEIKDGPAKHCISKLDELKSTLDYQNIKTEVIITSNSARHEILRFAKAHDIDLIVVAPHGKGIIGMLGSTATGILNSASCDVLAVRETDKAP
ncbi:MAG: universal stress protein [Lysobacterales bacterium]